MPTWSELREHIQRTLMLTVDEPAWLGLTWSFKSGKPGQEHLDVLQRQRVELVQAVGEPHVMILSDIIAVGQAQPTAMLTHNMAIAIGAIAIADGFYVMRHVMHLDSLRFDYFDRSLTYLAHEAARLRELIPAS